MGARAGLWLREAGLLKPVLLKAELMTEACRGAVGDSTSCLVMGPDMLDLDLCGVERAEDSRRLLAPLLSSMLAMLFVLLLP